MSKSHLNNSKRERNSMKNLSPNTSNYNPNTDADRDSHSPPISPIASRTREVLLTTTSNKGIVGNRNTGLTMFSADGAENIGKIADRFRGMMNSYGCPGWFGVDNNIKTFWDTAFPEMPESVRTLVKQAIANGWYTKEGESLRINIMEEL